MFRGLNCILTWLAVISLEIVISDWAVQQPRHKQFHILLSTLHFSSIFYIYETQTTKSPWCNSILHLHKCFITNQCCVIWAKVIQTSKLFLHMSPTKKHNCIHGICFKILTWANKLFHVFYFYTMESSSLCACKTWVEKNRVTESFFFSIIHFISIHYSPAAKWKSVF